MINTYTIDTDLYKINDTFATVILMNARSSQRLGVQGPTVGEHDNAPTIEYNPTKDTYVFIFGETLFVVELDLEGAKSLLLEMGN